MIKVDLSQYKNPHYQPGSKGKRALWFFFNPLLVNNFLPFSGLRVAALKLFGARIGTGCVIRPGVNIKHPWLLEIGDHTWIGENVWIDNLVTVKIGSHVCISQGASIITGNHRWDKIHFDLTLHPIHIADGAWIGAFSKLLPGARLGEQSVVTGGAIVHQSIPAQQIWGGNPCVFLKDRHFN
ncbi:MAG: colanic acid biosynthesis acetyltransferase WcaF [Bacteroidota bacterium]|jgi:putative colanic acid biosynthesis acetyltransferase WcaF